MHLTVNMIYSFETMAPYKYIFLCFRDDGVGRRTGAGQELNELCGAVIMTRFGQLMWRQTTGCPFFRFRLLTVFLSVYLFVCVHSFVRVYMCFSLIFLLLLCSLVCLMWFAGAW